MHVSKSRLLGTSKACNNSGIVGIETFTGVNGSEYWDDYSRRRKQETTAIKTRKEVSEMV